MYEKAGKRIETFPLFRKACIAMKKNGQFLFFSFELGGGAMTVGSFSVDWRAEDVNAKGNGPIHIYTPYVSVADGEADAKTYRKPVGEGRINIVIVQEQGKGLLDEEKVEHMLALLAREGWMSPLSRQTQESALHDLVKHPRTAIGVTEQGELVILVYSGRTRMSKGADYREMITIVRSLFPTIKNFMNVDGGGSAMIGIIIDGNFMELSYPATSIDSLAGMVRPVNTVLCLDIDEEQEKEDCYHD